MKSAYFCKDSLLKFGELTKTLFTSTSEGSLSRPKGRKFSPVRENFFSGTIGARRGTFFIYSCQVCGTVNFFRKTTRRGSWVVGHWVIKAFTLIFMGEPFPGQYNNKIFYYYIDTFCPHFSCFSDFQKSLMTQ